MQALLDGHVSRRSLGRSLTTTLRASCEHNIPPFDASVQSSTEYFHLFGQKYETSLCPFFQPDPAAGLPATCKGRAQIYEPKPRQQHAPRLSSSRQGEESTSSDMLSRAMQRWFTQLRRIQSLLHNLRRDSDNPSAVSYRLLTWQKIKLAKGFTGGFPAWWMVRPVKVHGSPDSLPDNLPSVLELEQIFADFRTNFRTLESWNLRHRTQILKATAGEHAKKAFQMVLGDSEASQVHCFHAERNATVIGVDAATTQVHLDTDLAEDSGSLWFLDDVSATVKKVGPCVFEVQSDRLLCPGQDLRCIRQIDDPEDMAAMLKAFWEQRWNRSVPPSEQDWTRILGFARAYLPRLPFALPPLTISQWDTINRRYKPNSATGPDGFHYLDLLKMPLDFKEALLSLLRSVEHGGRWPQQLLNGFGICVPKHSQAKQVSEFRPIIVLSTIYRSWSALRSKSLLQCLSAHSPDGFRGFLQQREAGDVWHYIQSQVELSLQQSLPLAGVISDVRKAFESIPRDPLFAVAHHVGIPAFLLDAWRSFLQSFQRRFVIHEATSEPILSTWGLPEGDSLSVVGMCLIDLCWDAYQRVLSPRTVPLSYVDNFEVLARSCAEVLTGYATMEQHMSLWSLELGNAKTSFWSTSAADRAALKRLGKPVVLQTADLGGARTFCRRRGPGSQQTRIDALSPLWSKLRRACLYPHTKEYILRQAFWPAALHAIGISLLPWKTIQGLRTQASRALGHGLAGSNPAIRLALLSHDMTADPGFYQLKRVVFDFRRFMRRMPSLLESWISYMDHYEGTFFSGPFSIELILWTVREPPLYSLITMAAAMIFWGFPPAHCRPCLRMPGASESPERLAIAVTLLGWMDFTGRLVAMSDGWVLLMLLVFVQLGKELFCVVPPKVNMIWLRGPFVIHVGLLTQWPIGPRSALCTMKFAFNTWMQCLFGSFLLWRWLSTFCRAAIPGCRDVNSYWWLRRIWQTVFKFLRFLRFGMICSQMVVVSGLVALHWQCQRGRWFLRNTMQLSLPDQHRDYNKIPTELNWQRCSQQCDGYTNSKFLEHSG